MQEFFKQEPRRLYVVPAPRFVGDVFDVTRNTLDQSFEGWLHALEAIEEFHMSAQAVVIDHDVRRASELKQKHALQLCPPVEPRLAGNGDPLSMRSRELTTQDYVQVMLATIREGHHHARWPTEVIDHFLAVEVMTGE